MKLLYSFGVQLYTLAIRIASMWNPKAKKYIVTCIYCEKIGFKPSILEEDFATCLERKAIVRELQKTLEPLFLTENGSCEVCSKLNAKE